jgi:hypothetical protein
VAKDFTLPGQRPTSAYCEPNTQLAADWDTFLQDYPNLQGYGVYTVVDQMDEGQRVIAVIPEGMPVDGLQAPNESTDPT